MKTRLGFVSNSSSSSFIIIGHGEYEKGLSDLVPRNEILVVSSQGETEFGWTSCKYRGVFTRINFAYLQTQYVNESTRAKWLDMLETAIREEFKCTEVVWLINTEYNCDENIASEHGKYVWGYIDHQSAASEGQNTEMFENMDTLKRFLFCEDSYVQGGNDNE